MPCVHGNRSWDCVSCYRSKSGGRGICMHERRRNRCGECAAAGLRTSDRCVHDRQPHQCRDCLGTAALDKQAWCSACGEKRLSKARRGPGGLCAGCEGVAPRAEQLMMKAIRQHIDIPPSGLDNLVLGGPACNTPTRRPDAIWLGPDHSVILELDEGAHASRAQLVREPEGLCVASS